MKLIFVKWANYHVLRLEFNNEDGKLYTRLYEKRDDFDFPMAPIVNFLYLSSNIPESLHMVVLFHS